MVCIESIRISHAQYPTGNCPVSTKFFSLFPQKGKGRRKKHWSKNSPRHGCFHHSLIFIRTNRYYFDRDADHVDCRSTNEFLSLSYPTRNVFQWASSTWLHIFWVERSRKNYTVPMGANESSWRERVSAMGKKYRVEKPRFFRWVERISIDSGIKRDLALQLITPDSRKSRDEIPIFRDRGKFATRIRWKVAARW